MTFEEWTAKHGATALPPHPHLTAADEAECTAALFNWFATMELTEGQCLLIMAAAMGRIFAKKLREHPTTGAEGVHRTINLVMMHCDAQLNGPKRQPQ